MLIERTERKRPTNMSNQDSVVENNMGSVSFEGDKADSAFKANGEQAHTALAILHSVEDTLNGGEEAPDFDETTFAGLEDEIAYFESNQKKIESLREFLANQSSQFRRDKEDVLLTKVQNQITTLSATLEIVLSGVTAKYERMQAELNIGKEPTEIEQKSPATVIEDTPSGWNRAKRIFTPAIAAAIGFALTGSKNLDAKNNAIMPPDVSPVTTQFTYEALQKVVSTIDKGLVDALNKAQARLALASIDTTKGAETTHVQGGGVPKDPETLFKTPAPEADTTAKVTEATVKSAELTPAMEQQANFILEDLPMDHLVGSEYRDQIAYSFDNMNNQFPGTAVNKYGSNYYEFLLNDNAQFSPYSPEFTAKLAAEKKYVDDLNAESAKVGGGKVVRVAVYYAGDVLTIGAKVIGEFNAQSTDPTTGQDATTLLKRGSLIIHGSFDATNNTLGNQHLFPIVQEGHFVAPISFVDVVYAEQNANLIKPGQTTIALTESKVVPLDSLLEVNKRIVAEIVKPEPLNPAADQIVSLAPLGKMLDGTPVPPTATPTDVPNSPFVAMRLTETPLDFKLEQQEYTNQRALTAEELAAEEVSIGLKAYTGLETTITDGQNSQKLTIVISGIEATDLQVNHSIVDALNIIDYKLDSSRPPRKIEIMVVANVDAAAKRLGVQVRKSESDFSSPGVKSSGFAFSPEQSNGENVAYVFLTRAFLQHYKGNTDQQGNIRPYQEMFPKAVSSAVMTVFALEQKPVSQTLQPKTTFSLITEENAKKTLNQEGNIPFDFLQITLPNGDKS